MYIRKYLRSNLLLIALLIPVLTFAQEAQKQKTYSFINYDKNFVYQPSQKTLLPFFQQIDSLILRGDRQINIVQIGDSHIQAGFFPNIVRNKIQSMQFFGSGGRGFIFPYKIAKTNNPWNYRINYTGEWEYCRNVQRSVACNCGLSGITVTTNDTSSTISIKPNIDSADAFYTTTRLRIFYKKSSKSFVIKVINEVPDQVVEHELYTEFIFKQEVDSIEIALEKIDEGQDHFELHGFSLETDYPGVVYSSTGVNGADLSAFLRCDALVPQLQTLNPNLIIISLGANDAYHSVFNVEEFKKNYRLLISHIKKGMPEASILLTTPGDGYRKRRYYNYNYLKAKDAIFDIAKSEQVAVWDFYTVMGGPNSIYQWYKSGLAQGDKLHLTLPGYKLQGELFFEAILNTYYKYLDNRTLE